MQFCSGLEPKLFDTKSFYISKSVANMEIVIRYILFKSYKK